MKTTAVPTAQGASMGRSGSALQIALLAIGLSFANASHAVTMFDNGAPDQVAGTNMHYGVVADDFTLAAKTDVSNLRFWSVQSAPGDYTGSIAWSIYSNVASAPGSALFSGTASPVATTTGLSTGFGYAEYVFDIPVVFQLNAGSYWLGLSNSPINNSTPNDMLWETTSTVTGSKGLYFDGGWFSSGNDHAFKIDGTLAPVPEPSGALLALMALAAAGFARRRSA